MHCTSWACVVRLLAISVRTIVSTVNAPYPCDMGCRMAWLRVITASFVRARWDNGAGVGRMAYFFVILMRDGPKGSTVLRPRTYVSSVFQLHVFDKYNTEKRKSLRKTQDSNTRYVFTPLRPPTVVMPVNIPWKRVVAVIYCTFHRYNMINVRDETLSETPCLMR